MTKLGHLEERMRLLGFDIRRNLKKPPRIHVKSVATGTIFGSFQADEPEGFEGWPQMNEAEAMELHHYMDNLKTVRQHLGEQALNEQSDYRLRLPLSFIEAIDDIGKICQRASVELDIYEPVLTAIIQQLKIAIVKLEGEHKTKALAILDRLGLADYKKMDYSKKIQAVFSELLSVHNKSEKLHKEAITLFDKDKSYSPKTLEGMANGEHKPSLWLVACAIKILADEKVNVLTKVLSENDFFILFAKPLLANDKKLLLLKFIKQYKLGFLNEAVVAYETAKS